MYMGEVRSLVEVKIWRRGPERAEWGPTSRKLWESSESAIVAFTLSRKRTGDSRLWRQYLALSSAGFLIFFVVTDEKSGSMDLFNCR
jgi:hypothetical protein